MRTLILLLVTLFVSVCFSKAHAQRCGGYIAFTLVDSNENITYPISIPNRHCRKLDNGLDLICDSVWKAGGLQLEILDDRPGDCFDIVDFQGSPVYKHPAGCGFRVMRILITRRGKKMLLTIKNAAMERDYFIHSIPFREGRFRIDLETATRIESSTDIYDVQIPGWENLVRGK